MPSAPVDSTTTPPIGPVPTQSTKAPSPTPPVESAPLAPEWLNCTEYLSGSWYEASRVQALLPDGMETDYVVPALAILVLDVFDCERIVLDNETILQGVRLGLLTTSVSVGPEPINSTLFREYVLDAWTDSEALAGAFAGQGFEMELASIDIASMVGPTIRVEAASGSSLFMQVAPGIEPTEIDMIREYEWYYGGDPFPRIEATLHETMHQRMYDAGTLQFEGGAMGEIAGGETDTIPWTSLVIELDQVTSRFASG